MPGRSSICLILGAVCLGAFGCRSTAPVVVTPAPPLPPPIMHWPGVDTTVAQAANALADRALIPADEQARGRSQARTGQDLARRADSLLGPTGIFALATGPDTTSASRRNAAIESFNEGAAALSASAAADDSLAGAALLAEAAEAFRAALDANPFDQESHYWLARVYQVQAEALGDAGATDAAITVLRQLVSMHNQRHDYLALLAEAHERRPRREGGLDAGALWGRAAEAAMDDARLGGAAMDSTAVFTYYARSSRAFIAAHDGVLALAALDSARAFAASPSKTTTTSCRSRSGSPGMTGSFLRGCTSTRSSRWQARGPETPPRACGNSPRQYARSEPGSMCGMSGPCCSTRQGTRMRACASLHACGASVDGAADVPPERAARVREDYGVMAFNIGVARQGDGDMRAALGYLMQSEATAFSQSARAAFAISRLLQNDIPASLAAALRAEEAIERLPAQERAALLRHIVELYRRAGERGRAGEYFRRLRGL